jgi:flagellar biogenesis protein FliO
MRYLATFCTIFSFSSLSANEPSSEFSNQIVGMLGSLLSLIICLILVTFFVKKILKKRIHLNNHSSQIKILEKRALNPKASLYLVEVEGQNFLIAESQNTITKIANIKPAKDPVQEKAPAKHPLSFSEILKKKLNIPQLKVK